MSSDHAPQFISTSAVHTEVKTKGPLLSVIIPVYNEAAHVRTLIEAVNAVDVRKEILVIDDGSADGSDRVIREEILSRHKEIRYIRHPSNRGKGAAIRTGIDNMTGDLMIIQDADLEYDPQDYHAMIRAFEKPGVDIVYGSRFLSGKRVTNPLHLWINRFMTFVGNVLYGSRLTDLETCYKMFRSDLIRSLDLRSPGFEVEGEITSKALLSRKRIVEVPVSYKGRNYDQGKKIIWWDGVKTLWILLKIRLRFPERPRG